MLRTANSQATRPFRQVNRPILERGLYNLEQRSTTSRAVLSSTLENFRLARAPLEFSKQFRRPLSAKQSNHFKIIIFFFDLLLRNITLNSLRCMGTDCALVLVTSVPPLRPFSFNNLQIVQVSSINTLFPCPSVFPNLMQINVLSGVALSLKI